MGLLVGGIHLAGGSMLARTIWTLAALIALPLAAAAEDASVPTDKLVERYTQLAGSRGNAESLVAGLRDDTTVKLSSRTSSTTFTPPTGKMGFGSVDNALALAEASLKQQGITNPTPEQLKAALVGERERI